MITLKKIKGVLKKYPIGSVIRLEDNTGYKVEKIEGYTFTKDSCLIIFSNGKKINSERMRVLTTPLDSDIEEIPDLDD